MNSELQKLLEDCLQNSTEKDYEVLKLVLRGIRNKQINNNGSGYIGGVLDMARKIDDKTCELTIPINPFIMNSLGIVHGGITATLIDSAMGSLSNILVPSGYATVTTQLNVHYIAPGLGDYLHCTAEVEHRGTKTMVLSATVVNSEGKKVAKATGSFFIIEK